MASLGDISGQDPTLQQVSPPFVRLTVHGLQGAFGGVIATKPFVRVHMMDASQGRWLHKSRGLHAPDDVGYRDSVFNIDSTTHRPYLRVAQGNERPTPWQPRAHGHDPYVQAFATAPISISKHRGVVSRSHVPEGNAMLRAPPHWEESFLIMDGFHTDIVLLFEVLDHAEDRQAMYSSSSATSIDSVDIGEDKGFDDVSTPVGWGFLSLSAQTLLGSRVRRLRLQLRRKQRHSSSSLGIVQGLSDGDEEAGGSSFGQPPLPDVFLDYSATNMAHAAGPQQEGILAATTGLFSKVISSLSPQRDDGILPLVLEISLEPVMLNSGLGIAAVELQEAIRVAAGTARGTSAAARDAGGLAAGGGAEGGVTTNQDHDVTAAESQLAPHHWRKGGDPCAIPDNVLFQLTVGARGAARLSLSPSGKLLAAAVANKNGTFEIQVFDVATGRLHSQCAAAHDRFIYDLAWHAFKPRHDSTAPVHPLLISCSGDNLIRIFEVPEDARALSAQGRRIRLHACLHLPSHVYTFSVHPALSADPHQLVLVCGGHKFGIRLCKVIRQIASPDGYVQHFVPQLPHLQEEVRYEWDGPRPDILCLRFTKQSGMTADNLYASDSKGHLMLFQVRFVDAALEGGRSGLRTSFVRIYSMREPIGVPIHGIEVVTQEMLLSKRLRHSMLHAIDDWVVLYSKDSTIRLASLQRGVVKIETQMSGLSCWQYPLRGCMSPDGLFLACGSETGELCIWNCADGKPVATKKFPQVELAGPILDTVWSWQHHLLACCAYGEESPPVLILVGGEPARKLIGQQSPPVPLPETVLSPPLVAAPVQPSAPVDPPPLLSSFQPRPRETAAQLPLPTAPVAVSSQDWAAQWMEIDSNPRSAVSFVEKRNMKEQILRRLVDQKGADAMEMQFASARNLPGGV
mmetsp:Transcript_51406/g.95060  ORF Transcript_51406/g.95060 Transcript_51406/m.95060 type:complete len:910 (-) Transcript_51406:41-2770(-)